MGCFSFMCQECGKPILSNSFTGNEVTLSLLSEGVVIQSMTGQYDSYGRVFKPDTQCADVEHKLEESYHWDNPFPDKGPSSNEQYFLDKGKTPDYWRRVCDLMFSGDTRNGIAAVHTKCQVPGKVPVVRSADDPNQGWGEDLELLGDTDPELELE